MRKQSVHPARLRSGIAETRVESVVPRDPGMELWGSTPPLKLPRAGAGAGAVLSLPREFSPSLRSYLIIN